MPCFANRRFQPCIPFRSIARAVQLSISSTVDTLKPLQTYLQNTVRQSQASCRSPCQIVPFGGPEYSLLRLVLTHETFSTENHRQAKEPSFQRALEVDVEKKMSVGNKLQEVARSLQSKNKQLLEQSILLRKHEANSEQAQGGAGSCQAENHSLYSSPRRLAWGW